MTNSQNFYFVFTPSYLTYTNKRFLVSPNTLKNYIGEVNAKTAILKAQKSQTDKLTLKYRKFGKLDIYVK